MRPARSSRSRPSQASPDSRPHRSGPATVFGLLGARTVARATKIVGGLGRPNRAISILASRLPSTMPGSLEGAVIAKRVRPSAPPGATAYAIWLVSTSPVTSHLPWLANGPEFVRPTPQERGLVRIRAVCSGTGRGRCVTGSLIEQRAAGLTRWHAARAGVRPRHTYSLRCLDAAGGVGLDLARS